MNLILLVIGFILLIKCADIFVDGCSNIAKFFGIPSLIIGLTIVAFGTSAPEAAVSLTAAINGNNAISIGNIVGSNIANLLLILGFSGIVSSIKAKKKVITRDFVFEIFSSIMLFLMVSKSFFLGETSAILTRGNGLILLITLGVYMYILLKDAKKDLLAKSQEKEEKRKFQIKDIFFIIIGILGIILGGRLVVDSAVAIAKMLKVTDHVIALTIVAVGTSLPELVTSVVATKKGEVDIAIGNVIGSNIFNILFILGLTSVICPLSVVAVSFIDIIIMLVVSVIVFLFLSKNYRIGKAKGITMLLMYVAYIIYIVIR